MRKRHLIVKDIHKVINKGGIFGALSFSGKRPCAGDLVCIQLAISECGKKGVNGIGYFAALFACEEIERKIGFFNYSVLAPVYGKSYTIQILNSLTDKGLFMRIPSPDTFSHITRKMSCYKLTDEGRKCLRLFSDTFNLYQREVKRAKVNSAEGLK